MRLRTLARGSEVGGKPFGDESLDDIVDLEKAAKDTYWPEGGRSLIVNTAVDAALKKDDAYKLALNIGGTEVIREGKVPRISGFDFYGVPNLPENGEKLQGMIAYKSAILAAFAPIAPAPGVRSQLVSYQVAIDEMTGISLNYRHWGLAQADRDFEVIECAYGYEAGLAAALKRICYP